MPPRSLAGFCFVTPHRHVSSYAPGNIRLMDSSPAHLPSTSEKASSSHFLPRSASDPTRQPSSCPNLEIYCALEVNKRQWPHLFLSRDGFNAHPSGPSSMPPCGLSVNERTASCLPGWRFLRLRQRSLRDAAVACSRGITLSEGGGVTWGSPTSSAPLYHLFGVDCAHVDICHILSASHNSGDEGEA